MQVGGLPHATLTKPIIRPTVTKPIILEPTTAPVLPVLEKISIKERQDLRKSMQHSKKMQKKEQKFIKQLEKNKPSFDTTALLKQFDLTSKSSSRDFVGYVMAGLSLSNAVGYANEELSSTLKADNVSIDENEINSFSRRMIRLNIIQHLAKLHKLPQSIADSIINLQITKDFGTIPVNSRPVAPAIRPPTQEPIIHVKKEKVKSPFLPSKRKS